MNDATATELRWIGPSCPDPEYLQRCNLMLEIHAREIVDIDLGYIDLGPWRREHAVFYYRAERARLSVAQRVHDHYWRDSGREARMPGWLVRSGELVP